MKKKILRSMMLASVIAVSLSITVLAVSLVQRQESAKSPTAGQLREKKPRDIAKERDWEVESSSESHGQYEDLERLTAGADAIVHGRIIDSTSFWDESGNPIDHGENITTEFTVDVYRILKDQTWSITPGPGKLAPGPIKTPLKIARNGGVVYENGYRAEVKVKEYKSLNPGKEFVLFLDWSTAYKAYILAGGASGAVMVNDDRSLEPLAKSKEIQSRLRGVDLETLIGQIQ